jgi:ribonuclease Z
MTCREKPIEMTLAGIPFSGVSIAGHETWFHFPSLNLAFDLGRGPTELISVPSVFLTHAHLDHSSGVAYWSSQRRLARMQGGVIRTDPSTVEPWRAILALHEALEGVTYDSRIEPISPGERVVLRKDLSVEAFRVTHRVPTLGFLASETRHRLTAEWKGRPSGEVREAVGKGRAVSESWSKPLVAFTGDTSVDFFATAPPEVFRARILLLECSFLEDAHRGRAEGWGHIHLSELAERADQFDNEVVVLTHHTLRTSPQEIRRLIARALPASLASRALPFLPD